MSEDNSKLHGMLQNYTQNFKRKISIGWRNDAAGYVTALHIEPKV